MKRYADLHLSPSLDDVANARSMAEVLGEFDILIVGLVVPPDRLIPTPPSVTAFATAGLDVAKRLDLKPRSREELLRSLRRFRSKYEIIAVNCSIPSVSRVAVRDRRVDIVRFPNGGQGGGFRRNLASTCRAALEFNVSDLSRAPDFEARLRRLSREIKVAAETSTSVIASTNASTPIELRAPRDIAALLHALGLPLDAALKGISEIPLKVVRKNRLRMGKPELEEGVKIVRGATRHE